MTLASKQLDENLTHLAWSLWTELGVAGIERKHRDFSIVPEELIILTSALSKSDPRLRDEALDWCIRYHHCVSPIRLQILAKKYESYIAEPFSIFSETLNKTLDTRTKWIILENSSPLKFKPSCKSTLRNFESPSMINFRLRSLFGVCAKADILTFLLSEDQGNFAISDLIETGYSKRRLAVILEELAQSGILSESKIRNQLRYTFVRRDQFIKLLGGIPKNMVLWDRILEVLLPIQACLQDVENTAPGVRVIDMRNLLNKLSKELLRINLSPPLFQNDFEVYWNNVVNWLLEKTQKLAKGEVWK